MADLHVIARVYPFDDATGQARRVIQDAARNQGRHIPRPLLGTRFVPPDGEGGAGTSVGPAMTNGPEYVCQPGLELTFETGPRTCHGFVFGTDPLSDVVLPGDLPGVGARHFALTFDERKRLVVVDLGSGGGGTGVTYDGQGAGRRSRFVWILTGHDIPRHTRAIVVAVHEHLRFQVVPHHADFSLPAAAEPFFAEPVRGFLQGATVPACPLRQLVLGTGRPSTEQASASEIPLGDRITLRRPLGGGALASVCRVWDVSTGDEYVLKEPSAAARQGDVGFGSWQRAALVMGKVSHEHIVKLLGSDFTPAPRLRFEYVSGGALDAGQLSPTEGVQVLCQCLSALEYLHAQEPPLVYRDVRPAHILVVQRPDAGRGIRVKLADFGLLREGVDPRQAAATRRYLAPEIFLEHADVAHGESYSPAADVWALGVTVLECIDGLPSGDATATTATTTTGVEWCEAIIDKVVTDLQGKPDVLKQFLLDNMLVMNPEDRASAADCYKEALKLADMVEQERSPIPIPTPTPTPAAYAQGFPMTVDDGVAAIAQQAMMLCHYAGAAAMWPGHVDANTHWGSGELLYDDGNNNNNNINRNGGGSEPHYTNNDNNNNYNHYYFYNNMNGDSADMSQIPRSGRAFDTAPLVQTLASGLLGFASTQSDPGAWQPTAIPTPLTAGPTVAPMDTMTPGPGPGSQRLPGVTSAGHHHPTPLADWRFVNSPASRRRRNRRAARRALVRARVRALARRGRRGSLLATGTSSLDGRSLEDLVATSFAPQPDYDYGLGIGTAGYANDGMTGVGAWVDGEAGLGDDFPYELYSGQ